VIRASVTSRSYLDRGAPGALREGDPQCLRQPEQALFRDGRKRHAVDRVDELQHAFELPFFGRKNGGGKHLPAAVAGDLVDFLAKLEMRADGLERRVIIDVGNIEHLTGIGHVARHTIFGHWEPDAIDRMQSGLDLGLNRRARLVDSVDCQSLGAEQFAQIGGQLEDDLIDILGCMDPCGDRLQAFEEGQATCDTPRRRTLTGSHVHEFSSCVGFGLGGLRTLDGVHSTDMPATIVFRAGPMGAVSRESMRKNGGQRA
jgi:hypothetical protein